MFSHFATVHEKTYMKFYWLHHGNYQYMMILTICGIFSKLHYNTVLTSMCLLKARAELTRDQSDFEQYQCLKSRLKMQIKSANLEYLYLMKNDRQSSFCIWSSYDRLLTRLLADLVPLSPSSQRIFHWILLILFLYCCYYS